MPKRKITIPFIECPSEITIVRFALGTVKGLAVIDSGSEMTIFDKAFIDANAEEVLISPSESSLNITGVSSKASNVKNKCASANLRFEAHDGSELPLRVDGNVINLSPLRESFMNTYGEQYALDMIIGSDTLRGLRGSIDYNKGTLTLRAPKANKSKALSA